MASVSRLGASSLRTLKAPAFNKVAFQGVRCYSAKTQVCHAVRPVAASLVARAVLVASSLTSC